MTTLLTPAQVKQCDHVAEKYPRCDAWLGSLLQLGIIRKPAAPVRSVERKCLTTAGKL